jgi:hypothetical protein
MWFRNELSVSLYLGLAFFTDNACHKTGTSLIHRASLVIRLSPLPNSSFNIREPDCVCICMCVCARARAPFLVEFVILNSGSLFVTLARGCCKAASLRLRSVNQAVVSTVAVVTVREASQLNLAGCHVSCRADVTSQSERIRGCFFELDSSTHTQSIHHSGSRVTRSGIKFLTGARDFFSL